uniref:Uncharacterized protein n=1 Tax=Octactis speculum TaxID=3111310 RepID=A0A7S2E2D5_9STRA|mmetsp:Transcript_57692/g.78661  ORF Transcript_57692/g.78661 Transcript_57692/m.78661 type:complete len:102 (+) Transcript_57692:539-844(+)
MGSSARKAQNTYLTKVSTKFSTFFNRNLGDLVVSVDLRNIDLNILDTVQRADSKKNALSSGCDSQGLQKQGVATTLSLAKTNRTKRVIHSLWHKVIRICGA